MFLARAGDRAMKRHLVIFVVLLFVSFASAQRAFDQNELGVAILLTYSSLERYIDLALWTQFGLEDENPDFTKLCVDIALFHQKGEILLGKKYQPKELAGSIALGLGVQLLATLRPELLPEDFFKPIRGLMEERNKCEFEHGISAEVLDRSRIEKYLRTVKKVIGIGIPELEERLASYSFPRLSG